ncbi:MAG: DNA cytosine methyltransferase, partial [Rikenella sp.]|nr:DNA cytosine methyltransferase [Rikenella sp.]
PEMLRAIREIRPRWVVGENVRGILSWSGGLVFEQVCADLEAAGYEVQPLILPACSVGAPHRRDRVWFVAHARCYGGSAQTQWRPRAHAQNHEQPEHLLGNGSSSDRADAGSEAVRERPVGVLSDSPASDTDCFRPSVAGDTRN